MIEVKGISKKYNSKPVVNDVSFCIKKGKITSFIGPNGAGKSTVLGMMSRLLKMDAGEVFIEGKEISHWNTKELSKVIGILKQSNHLNVRLSVRDLVSFGRFPHSQGNLTQEDINKIDEAIDYMKLGDIQHKFLDELSGGQRQRAFIGMVLAQDTDYIFLDEPLNNLDMKHSVQIMKILRKITDELGKTVVIVIHDINFASCYSDEIIALKEGEVVISGTRDEIMKESILSKLYEMEFNVQKKIRLKKLFMNVIAGIGVVSLVACSQPVDQEAKDPKETEKQTVEVTHEYGKTVVEKNPKNIVVFDFGILDALDYMGVEVKGLPKSGAIPSHLSKFESDEYVNVGGLKEPDLEKIYEMNPGLIIISGRQADYYEELSKIAPTLYMGLDSEDYLASFEKNMKVLADIFDKTDIVEKGLAEVNEKIEDLNKKVSEQGLNALVVLTNEGAVSAYGANSRFGMIHQNFGFKEADENLGESSTHGSKVSFEYISNINPNYLFVIDRGAVVGGDSNAQGTLDNELINSTSAAQNNNIVYLDAAIWYTATGGFNSTIKMVDEVLGAIEK